MENSYSLLYVDDEPDNLSTFTARFRKLFKIFTASSGKEGLDLLRKHDIQLVISDQKMPEMTGIQLCEEIKETHPDVVRIILTAYTESEDIINAINRGGVYQYVKKPWVGEDLKVMIEKGLAHYSFIQRNKDLVKRLYSSVNELETFYYRVSHEMQGHITSHQGLLDMAKSEKDLGQIKYFLDLLGTSTHKLDGALKGLNNVPSMADLTVEKGPIDLNSMLQGILFHLELEREARQIEITTNIQPGLNYQAPMSIVYALLEKVIETSITSSDAGTSQKYLSIGVRSDEKNIIIDVEDNGKRQTALNAKDSYVIDKAIGLLKGKIKTESNESNGTKTTVELPLDSPTKIIGAH